MPTDENGIGFHTRWLRPNEASLIAHLAYLIIRSLTMDLGKYLGEYLINLSVRILWKRVEVGKDRPYRHSLFYFSEYVILVSILKWIVSPISSRFDSCLASVPPLGMQPSHHQHCSTHPASDSSLTPHAFACAVSPRKHTLTPVLCFTFLSISHNPKFISKFFSASRIRSSHLSHLFIVYQDVLLSGCYHI